MNKRNIGVLTVPINKSGNMPLHNLVDLLSPGADEIYLVTGNDGYSFLKDKTAHVFGISYRSGKGLITRILKYLYLQLEISYLLVRTTRDVGLWVFFFGGEGLLIPIIALKCLGKKVILVLPGSETQMLKFQRDGIYRIVSLLSGACCSLAGQIVVYSDKNIGQWGLERYRDKISIAHEHFIDFEKFHAATDIILRRDVIGYIGRLREEKGAFEFVKAIPLLLAKKPELEFLIIGEGILSPGILEYIKENGLEGHVRTLGWVPHATLPRFLNELKLLVIPSETEGLPNIMLEAMACGTPVLATPVGAIPDIIVDQQTGFLMEDNSEPCIVRNVLRAVECNDLERIVNNSRMLMEKEFSYSAGVKNYETILKKM